MSELLLDATGRRRSPATRRSSTPAAGDATRGCAPRGPPTIEEIVTVMHRAASRMLLVRRGNGGRRREVGMDDWA